MGSIICENVQYFVRSAVCNSFQASNIVASAGLRFICRPDPVSFHAQVGDLHNPFVGDNNYTCQYPRVYIYIYIYIYICIYIYADLSWSNGTGMFSKMYFINLLNANFRQYLRMTTILKHLAQTKPFSLCLRCCLSADSIVETGECLGLSSGVCIWLDRSTLNIVCKENGQCSQINWNYMRENKQHLICIFVKVLSSHQAPCINVSLLNA